MPHLIIVLLGAYAILDSMSLGLGQEQRAYYVVLFLLTALAYVLTPQVNSYRHLSSGVVRCWIAATIFGCVMVLFQEHRYGIYIVGDAITFSLPILFVALADRMPQIFSDTKSQRWLLCLLLTATCAATVSPYLFEASTTRFQEPALMLMALTWVAVACNRDVSLIFPKIVVLLVVVTITLFSGARFALLLWLAMGAALILLGHATRATKWTFYTGAATLTLFAAIGVIGGDSLPTLEGFRVGSLIDRLHSGRVLDSVIEDGSMQNRILEADDALYTRFTHQGWLQWVLGSGHGATFDTGYAYYGDRALDNGQVHHIHFGLVLLYFRYGVLGVVLFAWLLASGVRCLIVLRRANRNNPLFKPTLVFSLASLSYLLSFLLFNQLVDPVASFAMAGHVVTYDLWKRRAAMTTRGARTPPPIASRKTRRLRLPSASRNVTQTQLSTRVSA